MAFIFSIFSVSNGHSDRDPPATSRWPNTIQLCVMGSFRSSIQVSSEVLALAAWRTANPCTPSRKINLRGSHRAIWHPRSLFLPSTIVKQAASKFQLLVFLPRRPPGFRKHGRQLISTTPCLSLFRGPATSPWFLIPIVFPRAILRLNMEIIDADISFVQLAIEEARAAVAAGEVPIGACIVRDGKILARSGNRTIRDCVPTSHAEIIVIREAARLLRNSRTP